MLQVMLAGLVLSNTITIKQAERIYLGLMTKKVPDNVAEVVTSIKEIIEENK